MTLLPPGRSSTAALLGATLLVGSTAAFVAADPPLTRDTGFAVVAPADGSAVGPNFLLRWAPKGSRTSYAVVVDHGVPAPGSMVQPGSRTLTVTGTALRLSLGRAKTGSPSARAFHTVTIVALDDAGRRDGHDAAVVHVRNRA